MILISFLDNNNFIISILFFSKAMLNIDLWKFKWNWIKNKKNCIKHQKENFMKLNLKSYKKKSKILFNNI